MKKISYVIPCYKSALTITGVINEIQSAMENLTQYTYEIVLVNDCSPDNTFEVIETLAKQYDNICGIDLAKNFGQHAALMQGFIT